MTDNKQQTEMNKEFVPYELALELKQLGFDEKSICNWEPSWSPDPEHEVRMVLTTDQSWLRPGWVCAPTYSQAFRWFREKYKLKYCIIPLVCEQGYSDLYESRIHQEKHSISRIGNYKIYEEAELTCLREIIKIVKEKQK